MGNSSSKDKKRRKHSRAVPYAPAPISASFALGAGCYWGTEKFVKRDFTKKFPWSILRAKVGFMSPNPNNALRNPTYEQICHSDNSEYVEVLYITLNDPHQHFEELIRYFFSFHDPTTRNGQGSDVGFQYNSYIFCVDDEQMRIAKKVRDELNVALAQGKLKCFAENKVATKIVSANEFTPAKREHQEYLMKNPNGYCNHHLHFKEWPIVAIPELSEI